MNGVLTGAAARGERKPGGIHTARLKTAPTVVREHPRPHRQERAILHYREMDVCPL